MKAYTKTWQLFLTCDVCNASDSYASDKRDGLVRIARAEGWCIQKFGQGGGVFCAKHAPSKTYEDRLREEASCAR